MSLGCSTLLGDWKEKDASITVSYISDTTYLVSGTVGEIVLPEELVITRNAGDNIEVFSGIKYVISANNVLTVYTLCGYMIADEEFESFMSFLVVNNVTHDPKPGDTLAESTSIPILFNRKI